MNSNFSIESRSGDVRIEKMQFMPEICQPADRFTNMIIDVAQAAKAFEAKIENLQIFIRKTSLYIYNLVIKIENFF